jgi:3-deoxy-D-manno-octulosonic-acid transferase
MKFDGAQTDPHNAATERLRRLAGIEANDIVFLAGSTQQGEEQAALAAYRELCGDHPRLRLILVPRHPERFEAVAESLDRAGLAWQRRSRLELEGRRIDARILLVDTIGELGAWWGTASIAFVGGSLGNRGGQNMIEPAAYGAAVSFGPNTRNFRDIVEQMLSDRAAVVVADSRELTSFVRRCLTDATFAETLGARARALVARQLGATARTCKLLSPLIEGTHAKTAKAA